MTSDGGEAPPATMANARSALDQIAQALTSLLDDDPRAAEIQWRCIEVLGAGWFRPWEQHRESFASLEMVPPGLVSANDWRPDTTTPPESSWHTFLTGGVGRKPT